MFLAGRFRTSCSQSQVSGAGKLHQHRLVSRVARGSVVVSQSEVPQRSRSLNGKNVANLRIESSKRHAIRRTVYSRYNRREIPASEDICCKFNFRLLLGYTFMHKLNLLLYFRHLSKSPPCIKFDTAVRLAHVKLGTHYQCPRAVSTGRVHGRWTPVSKMTPVFTGHVGHQRDNTDVNTGVILRLARGHW